MEGTLKDKIDALKNLLDSLDDDVQKSDEGTLAAGGRARKQLQELKRLAQAARLFCLERDHERKTAAKAK
jgi:hypothetical protein